MNQHILLFLQKLLQKDFSCLWILSVLIFLLNLPVLCWGIPDGHDLIQHFQFANTYLDGFKSGQYFLGWAANPNSGIGDVGIRFYPPLSHYVLAFFQLCTRDWFTSTWLSIYFWMLLGSIGSYFLAREWNSPRNSLFVGVLYAIAPYHLTQFYQYFLFSEFAAAGILPFCFLFLTKVFREDKFHNYLLLSLSVSLLILTHIPTTLIGVICLGLYGLTSIDWKENLQVIPKLILSGLLVLTMTSFYWVRFITEMTWVSHFSERFSTGFYDYQRNLFPLIFNPQEIYFARLMWSQDIVSIFTILFFLPFVFLVILKISQSRRLPNFFLAFLLTGSFSLFMSSRLSIFVWENFGLLQKIQFPWRWLSVSTLFVVLTFVTAISQLEFGHNSFKIIKRYLLVVFFVALSLYNISQVILPAGYHPRPMFEKKLEGLAEKESFDCWWPVWAKKEAIDQNEFVLVENRSLEIINWSGNLRTFRIGSGNSGTAHLRTYYYPHWKAIVNEQEVQVSPTSTGLISFPIPAEASEVKVYFQEPQKVITFYYLSGLGWILMLGFLPFALIKSLNQKKNNEADAK